MKMELKRSKELQEGLKCTGVHQTRPGQQMLNSKKDALQSADANLQA